MTLPNFLSFCKIFKIANYKTEFSDSKNKAKPNVYYFYKELKNSLDILDCFKLFKND